MFCFFLSLCNRFSLTKQRLTINGVNHHDEPSKKVKFEPVSVNTGSEANQDILIRHLQDRINDLQDDNIRLRDNQQSKSIYQEVRKEFRIENSNESFLFRMIIISHIHQCVYRINQNSLILCARESTF